jgi:hypothetical protein
MLWEVAEPVREGRYEGEGASWRNGDTRAKRPTRSPRDLSFGNKFRQLR